jgi:hypothetical protein
MRTTTRFAGLRVTVSGFGAVCSVGGEGVEKGLGKGFGKGFAKGFVKGLPVVCAFAATGKRMARKPMAHVRVIMVMSLPLLLEGRLVTDVISGL